MSTHPRRFGGQAGAWSLVLPMLAYGSLSFVIGFSMWPYFYYVKNETFIAIGVFAMWRYGWLILNYSRAIWYANVHFPMLRTIVAKVPEERHPQHVFFIIMSYNEEPWVTVEAIQSLMSNLSGIAASATLIVSTSGTVKEHAVISSVYHAHPVNDKVDLIIQEQCHGKRIAMGHALRAVARRYHEDKYDYTNCVCVFMDGDSYLPPFTLQRTLPFFAAFPKLGALTTNETAYINTKSQLYKSWFNLKFGQRHVLFQSHSLSHKVLTLTGRFSMFRASACVTEDFIGQIENDVLTHWLHGKFRFLMGDDKSSWFNLLKNNWKMLYIPDVNVISLESRDGSFIALSSELPYRWYGNTLRNNARTLALGPKKIGWFIWICILEQKITMWTALVGIVGAILLSLTVSFVFFPFYIAWVLLVRLFQLTVMALTGHPVSMLTIPLMLYNQWAGAIVKIRAQYHLSDQKWSKGGETQKSGAGALTVPGRMVKWLPDYMMYMAIIAFAFAMLLAEDVVNLPDVRLYANEPAHPVYLARMYGVVPDDSLDDAYALSKLVSWVPDGSVIQLPSGQLDFFESMHIERSHLQMRGVEGTHIVSHIDKPGAAIIDIHGQLDKQHLSLAKDVQAGDHDIVLAKTDQLFEAGTMLRLRAPNDAVMFRAMGSQRWWKKQPWVRTMMMKVENQDGAHVYMEHAVGLDFPKKTARLRIVHTVYDIQLSHFNMSQEVKGHRIEEVAMRFSNDFPQAAVDGIALNMVNDIQIEHIGLYQIGRHPLNIEHSYACEFFDLDIDGAWNKGKKGNGYVRFARSFYNVLRDSSVKGIRHITMQWGAAFNTLQDLKTEVDINFHGGNEHHNQLSDIVFTKQPGFKWGAITHVAKDAHWAPPEGVGNRVERLHVLEAR